MVQVKLTPTAAKAFNCLHPSVKKDIKSALKILTDKPYAGKELQSDLRFFRSFKIKRYRAIYTFDEKSNIVVIIAIGHRKDIYDIADQLNKN